MSELEIKKEGTSYSFRARSTLNYPRDEVFAFFSKPENLQKLTPDHLHFSILTPLPVDMKVGAMLDYRIKLYGIPFSWRSEITVWEPPFRFVDEQVKGPYVYWIHEHAFFEDGDKTIVQDHVRYWPRGGALLNLLFVEKDVKKIFSFREEKLSEFFP